MSIPKGLNDGDKCIIRVTNPEDPLFGVIKVEQEFTVKR